MNEDQNNDGNDGEDHHNSEDFLGQTPDFNFRPETVGPPKDVYEWFECVITEVAWRSGRTVFLTAKMNTMIQAMANRGMEPTDAADVIIARMGEPA